VTQDEVIKLILDLGESKVNVKTLIENLDSLKAIARAVATEGYGKLIEETIDAGKAMHNLGDEIKEVKKVDLSEIGTMAGSIFGAIKEGDVGGALQQVSQLATAVPMLAPFAAGILAVGGAAKIAWPVLKDWFAKVKEEFEAAGAMAKQIEELDKRLRDHAVTLDETTDAVKRLREEEAKDIETPGTRQAERAGILQHMMKGRREGLLKGLTQTISGMSDEERDAELDRIEKEYAETAKTVDQLAKKAETIDAAAELEKKNSARRLKALQAIDRTGAQKQAEDLYKKAMGGDAAAIRQVQEMLPTGSVESDIFAYGSEEAQRVRKVDTREYEEQRLRNLARAEQQLLAADHRARRHQREVDRSKIGAKIEIQHAKEDAAAEAKEMADIIRNAPPVATPEQRQHRAAERATSRAFQQETGQAATAEQAKMMGDEAIKNLGIVGNYNQARDMAVMDQIRRIHEAIERLTGQTQNMGMATRYGPASMQPSNQTWGTAP